MQPRRMRVLSITDARKNLLSLVQRLRQDGPVLITRNDSPAAVLQGWPDSDDSANEGASVSPTLIVLGAKFCPPALAHKTLVNINRTLSQTPAAFSKIIFVHGRETGRYAAHFSAPDVRMILSQKGKHPLITSVKSALAAMAPGDSHFIIAFLSSPTPPRHFTVLYQSLQKSKKGILMLKRNGQPIHPIAFSSAYRKYFMKTRKELGIPYILRRFHRDIQTIDVD